MSVWVVNIKEWSKRKKKIQIIYGPFIRMNYYQLIVSPIKKNFLAGEYSKNTFFSPFLYFLSIVPRTIPSDVPHSHKNELQLLLFFFDFLSFYVYHFNVVFSSLVRWHTPSYLKNKVLTETHTPFSSVKVKLHRLYTPWRSSSSFFFFPLEILKHFMRRKSCSSKHSAYTQQHNHRYARQILSSSSFFFSTVEKVKISVVLKAEEKKGWIGFVVYSSNFFLLLF